MEYLLKASAVVILFYLCYSLFLKKETFFHHNRWFLLIGLISALVFPLIVIPVEIMVEPPVFTESAFYLENTNPILTTQAEQRFQWQDVLPILYVAGLIIFLIQFTLQFGSLALLLIKNPKTKDGIYTYIIVKSKVSPFSFFKWIVYNPELFDEEELQLILHHEKIHVRQLHSIDIILNRLACVIFWFNPIMWLYKKQVHQNLEYIADDTTQNTATNEKDYQHLLVKTSVANQYIPITTNFYNSLIKKRIIMLNKSRSKQTKLWKSLLVLPLLSALLLSVNTKEIYVETIAPNNNLGESSIEKSSVSQNENIQLPTLTSNSETVEILFNKNSSDTYLADIKSQLKDKGVEMNIKTLERNKKDEITKINITFTTKSGSANYNVSDLNGIKPFAFKMKGNGSFGVGPAEKNNVWVTKQKGEGTNTFTFTTDDNEEHHEGDGELHFSDDENIFYLNGNAKIKTSTNGKNVYVVADSIKMKHTNGYAYSFESNDSTKVFVRSTSPEPLYIINGKRMTKAEVHELNPNSIDSISVLKDKNAVSIYGNAGKNGVVQIYSDDNKSTGNTYIFRSNKSKPSPTIEINQLVDSEKKPLIIVNGKIIKTPTKISDLNNDLIKSISVIKDEKAVEIYGDKAKDGVIIIKLKDGINGYNSDSKSPWKVRTAVTSVEFIDDENPSENMLYFHVTKLTTDKEFGIYKSKFDARGIKAKFSKIKRNSIGEITSIKISLTDERGSKASATWRDDEETIPKILVGKKGGKLRVTSSMF